MEWIQLWQLHGLALLTGSILDWIFGDPYHFPHMIRLMGNMISGLEKRLRKLFPEKPRFAGICLTLIMCLFWIIMPGLLFHITGKISWPYCKIYSGKLFLLSASGCKKPLCGEYEGMQRTEKGRYRRSQKGSFHDRRP